jgi:hypothetical protein
MQQPAKALKRCPPGLRRGEKLKTPCEGGALKHTRTGGLEFPRREESRKVFQFAIAVKLYYKQIRSDIYYERNNPGMHFKQKGQPIMKVLHRRWLLLLLILFLSGLVLTVPACFIFESAKNLIANELGKNAVNIAAAAATFMESDIEFLESLPGYRYREGENGAGAFAEHPFFIAPEGGGGGAALPAGGDSVKGELGEDTQYNQYLNQLITRFDKLEQETGAERIYCEKRISDMEKGYVIEQADLPAGHFSGKMIEEERIAFNKGIRTASGLKTDKDIGEYIIGYAPVVKRPSGETIGVVVVELSLEYAQNLISQTLYILLISFAAIALLVSLVISGLLQSRIKYHSTDE